MYKYEKMLRIIAGMCAILTGASLTFGLIDMTRGANWQAAELHDLVSLLFSLIFGISIFVAGVLLVQNPKIKGKRLWPN